MASRSGSGRPVRLLGSRREKSSVTASAGMIFSPAGFFQQGPAALGRGGEGSRSRGPGVVEVQTAVPHLAQGPGQRPENGLRRAGLASGVIEFGAQVPIGVVPLLLCLPKIIYRSGIAAGKIDFLKAQEIEPQIPTGRYSSRKTPASSRTRSPSAVWRRSRPAATRRPCGAAAARGETRRSGRK